MSKYYKRLDRYIIKKFLGTFVFSILIIISIAIVFDFAERLDDFLERQAPLSKILFNYYLNFIPYFVNLFTPLFVFISVIYFTSKLAQQSEIVAMLSNGISFRRITYPYMVAAIVIAILSFVLSNFIIPNSTKKKLEFEYQYVRNPYHNDEINIHRQIQPGIFVYLENFSVDNNIAYRFSMEKFENKTLKSKLLADYAQWDSTAHKWKMVNCRIRTYSNNSKEMKYYNSIDTAINLSPEDFKRRIEFVETMDYFRLNEYIRQKRMEGDANLVTYEIQRYQRFINPLCVLVLTIIALSVSSRKIRGGIGMHLGLGLGLSFTYILFQQISTNMAIGGSLPAILGVSLPTLIFAVIAIVLYRFVPK